MSPFYPASRPSVNKTTGPRLTELRDTGHNAFDSPPWMLVLISYLRRILAQSRVRIIGVCYGHQIVGRALGGEVVRSRDDNGKSGGWEVSVCEVELTEAGR